MAPLASVPISDAQKLEIVFQLGARDNVSSVTIQQGLNTCIAKLDAEQDKFNQLASQTQLQIDNTQKELSSDNDKIKDLEAQIEDIRKHQTTITSAMFQKKSTLEQNKALFQAAYERRKQDLQKQINYYTNISNTQGQQ